MVLTHHRAVLVMIGVTMMWATAGVVTRHLEHARSFEVTFWRSLFTVISLCAILPILSGREVFSKVRHGGRVLWLSGACWCVMFTAFMQALTMTTVANVLVTLSVGPLLTALFAWITLGQRIGPRTWLAIVVAGVGIAYMYGADFSSDQLAGTWVAFAVPVAGAINWTIIQRSNAQGQNVDLMPTVLIGASLSTLVTLPLAFPFAATAGDVGLLAFLGLVQLAIPCVLAVICARVLKAPEMSLLGLLEVIFGILLAWVGAGEAPAPAVLAGGALVIGALVINEVLGWRERA